MTQTSSFRSRWACRRIGKREKIYLIQPIDFQVQFPGVSFTTKNLSDYFQAKYFRIKSFRPLIIGTNNGNMMYPVKFQHLVTQDGIQYIVIHQLGIGNMAE